MPRNKLPGIVVVPGIYLSILLQLPSHCLFCIGRDLLSLYLTVSASYKLWLLKNQTNHQVSLTEEDKEE